MLPNHSSSTGTISAEAHSELTYALGHASYLQETGGSTHHAWYVRQVAISLEEETQVTDDIFKALVRLNGDRPFATLN